MKVYMKVFLMTIVWLSGGFYSWCMTPSSTGVQARTDTITINDIRIANRKLIQAKYDAFLVVVQDSIINNQRNIINELETINDDLQNRILKGNDINERLMKDVDKYKRKSKRASWAAIGSGSAFIVLLLIVL